ncbi:MAG: TatD family hydrolase [Leptolyngbyaceae cyanobacterium bins.59]|nr:TatD family hydrolase [Leptolyngbyaceae cyanobacterium bins.59]
MQLIDTHVHINFDVYQPDLRAVVQRWRDAGIVHVVHSCVEPAEFRGIQNLAHQFQDVSFAVGLHPLDVEKWRPDSQSEIQFLAESDARVVAIGETGLDFYKASNREEQEVAFKAQLEIAQTLNLPVIIHCRDAAGVMVQFLREFATVHGLQGFRGVMHCWGGNPQEMDWFLELGFYISFSGTVTFKNALPIQECARQVPNDRFLVETDCPFLSPVPKRGERRNEPSYVRYVAEKVANLRGVSLETVATQSTLNACNLFRLPVIPDPLAVPLLDQPLLDPQLGQLDQLDRQKEIEV